MVSVRNGLANAGIMLLLVLWTVGVFFMAGFLIGAAWWLFLFGWNAWQT